MKKTMRMLALVLAMLSMLSVAAFAAGPTDNGKATIESKLGADGTVTFDESNDEKINVTYTNASQIVEGKYYLVLMVAGDGKTIDKNTILYIDQVTAGAGGTLTFDVYPSSLKKGVIMIVAENIEPTEAGLAGLKAAIIDVKYILGDANDDGVVNVIDLTRIAQYLVGKSAANIEASDTNQDGKVDIIDLTRLAQFLVGLARL